MVPASLRQGSSRIFKLFLHSGFQIPLALRDDKKIISAAKICLDLRRKVVIIR
jgi:hypothetical protein